MYKFISYDEYIEASISLDENGETVQIRTSPYAYSHPRAVSCPDNIEVVLSCSTHKQQCGCVTHAEAVKHIKDNWSTVKEGLDNV